MFKSIPIKIIIFTGAFAGVLALLCTALVLTALIPQDTIRENSLTSAQVLSDGEVFPTMFKDAEGSRIDHYADAILLNIAYHYDGREPLRSVMLSAYYFTPDHQETENYLLGIRDGLNANRQYMRYWHGSILLLRPLLTILDYTQIRILNAVILLLLYALFMVMTIRKRLPAASVAMTLGLILTAVWFVPFSLEYTWNFCIMLAASCIAVALAQKDCSTREDGNMQKDCSTHGIFFLIVGMVTNYFDFLTTETITLLIPLLLFLYVYTKREKTINRISFAIRSCMAWGIGYAGMWVAKWGLTAIVFRENVLPYVSEHIGERLGGDLGLNLFQYLAGALFRNIGCLFPLGYGAFGAIIGIALVIIAAYFGYVYHTQGFDKQLLLLYALAGLVPYVRYLILHNHAYLHCFFTYRAQCVTVIAVVLIIAELTGGEARHGK
ncbi:MAG: hypothetical protein K6E16_04365 [Lachnospiraceae bacterium]|nr:hypothetical protein [Lachnospiraceae bacterium]